MQGAVADANVPKTGRLRQHRWDLSALARARRPINVLMRTRLVRCLASPRNIDDYLGLVDPAWSVHDVRARVVSLKRETSDATSLYLRPNENWRGFRAGQFVKLCATIAGVRHTRCFSLSSAPEDRGHLRVTIKAVPGGRVSGWVGAGARVGDVVELSQAMGQFVLPDPLPPKLLFISGGSGITPILSMIRHLEAVAYDGSVACLHYARREVIGGDELALLAHPRKALRLAVVRTGHSDENSNGRRLSPAQLDAFAPEWTDCDAFVCGPSGLIAAATSIWQKGGAADRLRVEHFAAAATSIGDGSAGAACRLVFAKSRLETEGRGGVSLLEQAEAAGLHPSTGCRMGICRTCTCRKVSGTVRNQRTGEVSSQDNELIQLCVNSPVSNVTLDL
jgi:stearoyl-CoA 9-desaturase NADPH oxidoreductase